MFFGYLEKGTYLLNYPNSEPTRPWLEALFPFLATDTDVSLQVLLVVSFQIMIILVLTPCSLGGGCHVLPPYLCPTLKKEVACFSETLVSTVNATRYPVPEDQTGYQISIVLSLTSVKPLTSSTFRQAYTNPRRQIAVASNFPWWSLIFVGPYYESCYMSVFWRLEFWSG
jgi:hypothetical protein